MPCHRLLWIHQMVGSNFETLRVSLAILIASILSHSPPCRLPVRLFPVQAGSSRLFLITVLLVYIGGVLCATMVSVTLAQHVPVRRPDGLHVVWKAHPSADFVSMITQWGFSVLQLPGARWSHTLFCSGGYAAYCNRLSRLLSDAHRERWIN